jgi:hypothetical protein
MEIKLHVFLTLTLERVSRPVCGGDKKIPCFCWSQTYVVQTVHSHLLTDLSLKVLTGLRFDGVLWVVINI